MHANIDDFQTRNLVKIISKCIRILMILRPQYLWVVVTGLDFRVRAGRDFWYFFENLLKYLEISWNFLKFLSPSPGHFYNLTVNWAPQTHLLASLVEIYACKDASSSLHAVEIYACKEELASLHGEISTSEARKVGLRAQFSVRL